MPKRRRLLDTLRYITNHPLTRERPLGAVLRFAGWQVISRLRREIQVDWVGGSKLCARNGMTGATGNIYCGLHEFPEMGFALHLLRPGDLFLDVGANIGSYTVLASKVCGARSIAYEPDPDAVAALSRNIAVNGIETLATVRQAAVGDHDGEITFTVGLDTMNHVADAAYLAGRRVAMVRLDDESAAAAASFIKLDVEGFEVDALRGAQETLSADGLLALQSELQSEAVRDQLASRGFRQAWYDPFKRELSTAPNSLASTNALFIRRIDEVRRRLATAPRRRVLGVEI